MLKQIQESEAQKQIADTSFKRYALSVVSGQESIVVQNLTERVKKQNLEADIDDYLVPSVNENSIKNNKKVTKVRKLYPGYVFVHSKMNDKIWYVIRNTPGVRIIVWAETRPIPLTEKEYQDILRHVEEKNERADLVVPYKVWDIVLLKDGNFSGTKGVVREVDAEKSSIVVNVEILGRLTPVMVGFDKVELV